MKLRSSRLENLAPHGVLLVVFLILYFVFEFNGLFGQDSHEYFRYAKAVKLQLSDGIPAGGFLWPKLFPFLGAVCSFSGLSVLFSMQLISLFACAGAIYFAQKSIQLLYGKNGSLFLILAAVTQVYFVRMGLIVMSDALCTFFVVGAVYAYLKVLKDRSTWHLCMLIAMVCLALFTRYASIPFMLVLVIHAVWKWTEHWDKLLRLFVIGLCAALGIALVFFNSGAMDKIVQTLSQWHIGNFFRRTQGVDGRVEQHLVPNVAYIWSNFFHLGFLSIGVFLLPWIRKWNFQLQGLWIAVLVYLLFIGGLPIQNQRFMVLTHLPVLLLLFPAFVELNVWLKQKKIRVLFLAGVLLFNGALFYLSFKKTYKVHQLEKQIVAALQPFDDSTPIYSFYVDQSFASYDLPNPTQSFWEPNPDFISGGIVVFNLEKFEKSWEDGIVMQNWELLQKQHTLLVIKELPENWKIYRIK